MSDKQIGMLLVQRGVLTHEQVDRILDLQQQQHKPFGKLARELFHVDDLEIWSAWAEQVGYFCQHVDLACEPNDPAVLELVLPREAWALHILPLRHELGELVVATTITDLPEAMALLNQRLDKPIRFVVPDRRQLEQYIIRRYEIVSVEAVCA